MKLDLERIHAILNGEHSYYGGRDIPIREDARWDLGPYSDFIQRYLSPTMRVLDVGCGNGHILMEMSKSFQYGLGIDNDPDHIQMAEDAKRTEAIENVEFRLLDYPRQTAQIEAESFDMVTSIRGPVPDTAEGIQAAYRLLRDDGLLFCHEIGELHHREVDAVFGKASGDKEVMSLRKRYCKALEENGFSVRLAADNLGMMYFPDIYAWLAYESNLWAWLGMPLPGSGRPSHIHDG